MNTSIALKKVKKVKQKSSEFLMKHFKTRGHSEERDKTHAKTAAVKFRCNHV